MAYMSNNNPDLRNVNRSRVSKKKKLIPHKKVVSTKLMLDLFIIKNISMQKNFIKTNKYKAEVKDLAKRKNNNFYDFMDQKPVLESELRNIPESLYVAPHIPKIKNISSSKSINWNSFLSALRKSRIKS